MYTTTAFVLRAIPIGEADALITFYTKDFGKICARAQGIQKEGAKLRGHVEPLSVSTIQFVMGKYGERLTYAQLHEFWESVRYNWRALQTAWYFIRLIDRECLPGAADAGIWEFLMESFRALAKEQVLESALVEAVARFERGLIQLLGYGDDADALRALRGSTADFS